MMKITQTLDHIMYGYDTTEFLPIYIDGELSNRNQFIAYKARKAFLRFSDAFDRIRDRAC
jgi:hypothetical protein